MKFKKHIGILGITLVLFGLFYSNASISLGLFFIVLQAFISVKPKDILKSIISDKISILLVGYYIISLLSFFYTDNKELYLQDIQVKLPFLLIPIGLTYKPLYSKNNLNYAILLFIGLASATALLTLMNYIFNYQQITAQIKHSKPIPIISGISHIYFSVMLACATFWGFLIVSNQFKNKIYQSIRSHQSTYRLILLLSVINFLLLHVFTTRTGLMALYLTYLAFLIIYIYKSKKIIIGVSVFVFVAFFLVIAVNYLPPLKKRIYNTKIDIKRYMNNEDINYWSISMRLNAIDKTIKIFKKSPIIGVGKGDFTDEINKIYAEDNPKLLICNRKGPHNQYFLIASTLGVIGLILFLCLFFTSLKLAVKDKNYFSIGFLFILFLSMLAESFLERTIGNNFAVLFILLLSKTKKMEI